MGVNMLKVLLEDKWKDDVPVYEFFSGAEAKQYHRLLKNGLARAEKSLEACHAKLADFESPGHQKGIEQHRAIKNLRANIRKNTEKRDAAKFRIDKIETAIKDWFAE